MANKERVIRAAYKTGAGGFVILSQDKEYNEKTLSIFVGAIDNLREIKVTGARLLRGSGSHFFTAEGTLSLPGAFDRSGQAEWKGFKVTAVDEQEIADMIGDSNPRVVTAVAKAGPKKKPGGPRRG